MPLLRVVFDTNTAIPEGQTVADWVRAQMPDWVDRSELSANS